MLFPRYVLECVECGVIYRSRQYWFGNDDPVKTVVRTELRHAWPGVRFDFRVLVNLYVGSFVKLYTKEKHPL